MKLKGIIDEDFINYKNPCMTLEFPICIGLKCNKINDKQVCQNSTLAAETNIEIDNKTLINRYISNPITESICCQGLEPLDTFEELLQFIDTLRNRYHCNDTVVIYTGYNKDEVIEKIGQLKRYENIVVKFGRFLLNRSPKYDEILGVTLASDNQYAEKIS